MTLTKQIRIPCNECKLRNKCLYEAEYRLYPPEKLFNKWGAPACPGYEEDEIPFELESFQVLNHLFRN